MIYNPAASSRANKEATVMEPTKLDIGWLKKLCDAMDAVLLGGKKPRQIKGATSIRCGLGLALDCIDQTTTMTEAQAWDFLDERNAQAVKSVIRNYGWAIDDWKAKQR